jgi:arginine:agmatine antiporter
MNETHHKKIGPFLATMLVVSSMVGSGVFLLPAALGAVGSIALYGWLVAAAAASLVGGVFALLALANPGAAGLFSYVRDAFGGCAGFIAGALYWASCLVAIVAIALAVAGYLSVFIPVIAKPPGLTVATIAIIWLLVGANFLGPRFVARMQSWAVFLGLVPVLIAAIGGWFFFHPAVFSASWNVSGQSDLAILPRATVIAFWAFLGIETAIILAVRVRNPLRDVPIGTLGGLAISTLIYIAASTALTGILPAAALAKSSAPFADAFLPVLGAAFAGVVALCAMLKASGTLAATVLLTVETAECESVMGRLRSAGAAVAPRASFANLMFTGVVTSVLVVISVSPTLARQFTIVTNASVVLSLGVYFASALALLRLGNALPANLRVLSWIVAVLCALLCVALIAASETTSLVGSAAFCVLALVVYSAIHLRTLRQARLLAEA